MTTRTIRLKSRPTGRPQTSNFTFTEEPIPAVGSGELLLSTLYISVDHYLRGKMATTQDPFEIGVPSSSKIFAEVVVSRHEGFPVGDIVTAYLDWKEYQRSNGVGLQKIDLANAPLTG